MATPRLPDLSRPAPAAGMFGSADPPSVPGWRDKITDAVFADAERNRALTCLQVAMGMPYRTLIRAAAETRGLSTSAYVRRAVGAFVAADLGLDFPTVASYAPPVRSDRSHGRAGKFAGTHGPGHDDGAGYGHWHACAGCAEVADD